MIFDSILMSTIKTGKEKPKAFPSLDSNGTLELVVLLLAHLRVLNFAPIVIIGNFPLGVLALILRGGSENSAADGSGEEELLEFWLDWLLLLLF